MQGRKVSATNHTQAFEEGTSHDTSDRRHRRRADRPGQRCGHSERSSSDETVDGIERVTVGATELEIQLSETAAGKGQDRVLTVPWAPRSAHRRREIIQGVEAAARAIRAMRTKAREGFIRAIRDGRRWLDELLQSLEQAIASLTTQEGKSERAIRMTLSLAFLSPPHVEAAIDRRLPRGFSVRRLTDLPMLWSEQSRALGLQEPG